MFLNIMQLVSGFVLGGLNLAVFNLVFAYSKPERSAGATAVFNMLINLASFIAPFLGDACYKMFGVYVTFFVGAGFRILALIPLVRLVGSSDFTGRRGANRFGFRKVGFSEGGEGLRLIIAIVKGSDASGLLDALAEQHIGATRLAATGGFMSEVGLLS